MEKVSPEDRRLRRQLIDLIRSGEFMEIVGEVAREKGLPPEP